MLVVERSIIQVGSSALAITLPASWARMHGLKPRDKVEVEVMADGSLRVTPQKKMGRGYLSRTIRVGVEMDRGSIVREVVASYLAGFARIKIEYSSQSYPKVKGLRRLLEEVMLGLTLVDEGAGYMEFYVTVDPGSMDFWDAVSKAYHATLAMLRDTIGAVERGDAETLESIPERDTLVDRLYLYSMRKMNMALLGLEPFNSLGLSSLAEAPSMVMAVKSIERVADHTTIIASNSLALLKKGRGMAPEVLDMVKEAFSAFETSGKALLGRSRRAAERVAEVIDRYPGKRFPSLSAGELEEALILDSARRILGYSLDIAESVLDLESVREAAKASMQIDSGDQAR